MMPFGTCWTLPFIVGSLLLLTRTRTSGAKEQFGLELDGLGPESGTADHSATAEGQDENNGDGNWKELPRVVVQSSTNEEDVPISLVNGGPRRVFTVKVFPPIDGLAAQIDGDKGDSEQRKPIAFDRKEDQPESLVVENSIVGKP